MRRLRRIALGVTGGGAFAATLLSGALARAADAPPPAIDTGDTAWVITA